MNLLKKKCENFEPENLISNKMQNSGTNSYSQSQRTIIQSPVKLNPEQFNNDVKTKLIDDTTCQSNRLSHENIKDVIIQFI